MEDQDLIKLVAKGQGSALKELMARHEQALYYFILGIVKDPTTTQDLVQTAFTKLFFNASKYQPKSSVKTFLFTIGRNATYDHLRKYKKYQQNVTLDSLPEIPTEVQQEPNSQIADLFSAIDNLPLDLKSPVQLVYLKEMSYKEASEELHCSPKQVDSALQKAKKLLKEQLQRFKKD